MVAIQPITPNDATLLKAVRLRALEDTPSAFGSTYAQEARLTDEEWAERASRWTTGTSVVFLAMEGNSACGIAASFIDQEDASVAHLVSMWTAPTHRRRGIGLRLVNEVIGWGVSRGCRTIQLMVTSSNDSAVKFYERLGFTMTGRIEPYPNDPALVEYEMDRQIP